MVDATDTHERPRLLSLVRELPGLVSRLIRDEIRAAQAEMAAKAKAAGLGTGLVVAGAVFGMFALGALITTAILGLSTALEPWLSALIVAIVLLVIAGILAFIGIKKLKTGVPPVPTESINSMKQDLRVVKGNGK